MITKAFAVYDSKGQFFGVPFFMQQAGMAIRGFMDLVNDPQTMVNKHPGDYILYEIGEFDDSTGVMTSKVPPLQLGIALDFKTKLADAAPREVANMLQAAKADLKNVKVEEN